MVGSNDTEFHHCADYASGFHDDENMTTVYSLQYFWQESRGVTQHPDAILKTTCFRNTLGNLIFGDASFDTGKSKSLHYTVIRDIRTLVNQ